MKQSFWFSASLLVLIWTIYYYAKRTTGGVTNTLDNVVCGIVGLVCIFIIFFKRFKRTKIQKSSHIFMSVGLKFSYSTIFRRTSSIFVVVFLMILNSKWPNLMISFSFGKL